MKLKAMRVSRGMNQGELSRLCGVGINTILKIEKNGIGSVSVSTLKKIATALDTTVVDLFFENSEKEFNNDEYNHTARNIFDVLESCKIIQIIPVNEPMECVLEDNEGEFCVDIPCLALVEFKNGERRVAYMDSDCTGNIAVVDYCDNALKEIRPKKRGV